ncbi:MAG: oxygen-independent coproporphyrinogen oxidase [Herbinix sp.]|jgi:oxygen-independent coproporphyrinogen-3 oxidase|nr:oxygen-independent coproporphyrinogen oxidase [Herbinix sp.]
MVEANRNLTDHINQHIDHVLGIYIHIPFCVKKCNYCDFLSAPSDENTKRKYVEALLNQIRSYQGKMNEYSIPSIFIGGGTPSSLDASDINLIMKALRETFHMDDNLEATIEINPGTITKEKLLTYKEAGINRLSFGLQSADDRELKLLGRIHTFEQFLENYHLARETGFSNINVDLMSALPGQTIESWENTLKQVASLEPEHISAYSLMIEEGTPFYSRFGEGMPEEGKLPEEDADRQMYHRTKELLKEQGYHRYEISNYAKQGYECRHNSSYWTGIEYLGLGLGAASLLSCNHLKQDKSNGSYIRFHMEENLNRYIDLCGKYHNNPWNDPDKEMMKSLYRDMEHLSEKQRMEEFMYLGLRLCEGIKREDFLSRFHVSIESVYGDVLLKLIKDDLIIAEGDCIRLSEYGIDVSNIVLSEFLIRD